MDLELLEPARLFVLYGYLTTSCFNGIIYLTNLSDDRPMFQILNIFYNMFFLCYLFFKFNHLWHQALIFLSLYIMPFIICTESYLALILVSVNVAITLQSTYLFFVCYIILVPNKCNSDFFHSSLLFSLCMCDEWELDVWLLVISVFMFKHYYAQMTLITVICFNKLIW